MSKPKPSNGIENDSSRTELTAAMGTLGRRTSIAMFVRAETADSVFNNGTVSFIKLPSGRFILTNEHVWNAFEKYREKDKNCRLKISGLGLAPVLDISEAKLVDIDRDLDICVLEFPAEPIEDLGKEFCDVSWPPKRAEVGESILFGGYPGKRGSPTPSPVPEVTCTEVYRHELVLLSPTVEAVSEQQLRMAFKSEKPELVHFSSIPITDFIWGGMSGSLIYRLDRELRRWVPCALYHSAGSGTETVFYGTHLDYINKDGTLKRAPHVGHSKS